MRNNNLNNGYCSNESYKTYDNLNSALWEIWGAVQLAYNKDAYDDKMNKLYEISKGAMVRAGQIKDE